MRFKWLINRVKQNQFKIIWGLGKHCISDYFTKKYPGSYHKAVQSIYLYIKDKSPDSQQGCVEILQQACGPKQTATTRDPTETSRSNSNQAGQYNHNTNGHIIATPWKNTETKLKDLFS